MAKPTSPEDKVLRRLDRISELLEDIFILQATKAGMKNTELRKIRGVAMARISRIKKHLEK